MARNQNQGSGGRRGGRGGSGQNQGRSKRSRSPRPQTNRHFPRTARLNALLQEIAADFFERVDDERFDLVTVAGVEVDNDLNRAQVFVSGILNPNVDHRVDLDDLPTGPDGEPDEDDLVLAVIAEYRVAVQGEIAAQTRLRKTPEVVFVVDPAMRAGARIEEILSTLDTGDRSDETEAGDDTAVEAADTDTDTDTELEDG